MNSTTLSKSKTLVAEDLLDQLLVAQKVINDLVNKVHSLLPTKYGSGRWWEKEVSEGLREIKLGKGITFGTVKELQKHLGL